VTEIKKLNAIPYRNPFLAVDKKYRRCPTETQPSANNKVGMFSWPFDAGRWVCSFECAQLKFYPIKINVNPIE